MKMTHRFLLAGATAALLASCATTETDRDVFLKADANKDGLLSLDEVNKAGLPRLFNRFDVDGDGAVTLTEARAVESGFDAELFTERDLNRDGKVAYAEYEAVALRKGGLKSQFTEVDLNRNGIIEMGEAQAYVAKRERQ
jgi:Ca2+-binding EF-hand superfamily protein